MLGWCDRCAHAGEGLVGGKTRRRIRELRALVAAFACRSRFSSAFGNDAEVGNVESADATLRRTAAGTAYKLVSNA